MSSSDSEPPDDEFLTGPCPVCSKIAAILDPHDDQPSSARNNLPDKIDSTRNGKDDKPHKMGLLQFILQKIFKKRGRKHTEDSAVPLETAKDAHEDIPTTVAASEVPTRRPTQDYYIDSDPEARTNMDSWAPVCDLCALVRDLDKYWSGSHYNGPIPSREDLRTEEYFQCCGRISGPKILNLKHEFGIRANHSTPDDVLQSLQKKPRYGVIFADPISDPVVKKWQYWSKTCEAEHEECTVDVRFMPSRVLDLQDPQSIKLIDTANMTERHPYTALSHCWGRLNTFVTTPSTLDNMRLGFRIDDLPASFRDAVLVTQTLGVQYLWIDSLCIIQGDTADLVRELSAMEEVYANSHITIAAANSADDTESFLKKRPFSDALLRIHSGQNNSVAELYLQDGDVAQEFFNQTLNEPYNGRGIEPIDYRAWTLQERYLPMRMLYFGTHEITWHCHRWLWHESRAAPNSLELLEQDDPARHQPWTMRDLQPREEKKDGKTILSYESWYNMIERRYSTRIMSFETDKLTAIGGLASYLAKQNNARYCAGLWWDDMLYGILWKRGYDSTPFNLKELNCGRHSLTFYEHSNPLEVPRPEKWRAPSWSWASVNGPVSFLHNWNCHYLDSVRIRDCHLESKYENPYTELNSGFLDLDAHILPLEWLENDTSTKNIQIKGYPDYNDADLKDTAAVILMYTGDSLEDHTTLQCLLVRKAGGNSKSAYERIGLLEITAYGETKASFLLENAPITYITLL